MESTLSDSVVLAGVTFRELIITVHIFGVAIGAGAAFFSEFLFFHIMKDKKVTSEEFSYLALASKIVWVGLVILAASGLVLFLLDPDRLLESSKFLAKISIVFLLFINGVIFHARHLPKLKKHVGKKINKSKPFAQSSKTLFMSGGASTISWATVLVLGAISGTTLGYFTILALYSLALGIALIISQIIYYRYV